MPDWRGRFPAAGIDGVTAYFITTDRSPAAESLRSLERQGLRREVVVVRNVAPTSAAYSRSLTCPTAYALLLDDDVVLQPDVIGSLATELEERRREVPNAYWLHPTVIDELTAQRTGGVKLFYAPLLKGVGFPDTTHVAWSQRERAQELGYTYLTSDRVVGVHKAGTPLETYRRFLWLWLREQDGKHRGVDLPEMLAHAEEKASPTLWAACLGFLDGASLPGGLGSKDATTLGAVGATLDFERVSAEGLRAAVYDLYRGRRTPGGVTAA